MEQRIDSNNKPEFAAGTDPAYIPGLTAPAPLVVKEEPEKKPEKSKTLTKDTADEVKQPAAGGPDAAEETSQAEASGAAADPDAAGGPDTAGGPDAAVGSEESQEAGVGAGTDDGPVFEVSDRRGSIRVAREGIRFVLDDQEAEFDWEEIGAVETTSARFGRRFTVTVHMTTRRWFNAEVEAPARSALKEWTAQLDAALDAYFEES